MSDGNPINVQKQNESTLSLQPFKHYLLVQVSGNSLHVNENVLNNLKTPWSDNVPVVILSVLGEPKSMKTSLRNYVLDILGEKENLISSGDENADCKNLQGLEGILICSFRRFDVNGSPSIWLLLDIWVEDPKKDIYNKLVDFCLNMSSGVIYLLPRVSCSSCIKPTHFNLAVFHILYYPHLVQLMRPGLAEIFVERS